MLPAEAIDAESSGIIVSSTTSLAVTSSIVTPSPAWICAPTSTTSSALSDFVDSAPFCVRVLEQLLDLVIIVFHGIPYSRMPGQLAIGVVDVTRCMPAAANRCSACVGVVGEVGDEPALAVGDGDRRHAVGDEVDLLREAGVLRDDLGEEVIDRALHAVARGLARDHDRVRGEQRRR